MNSGKKSASSAVMTFASGDLATYGHGVVLVARNNGAKTETALFVVDTLATGVRRVNRSAVPQATFLSKVLPALHAAHGTTPVPPSKALALISGAVAFAKSAGFAAPEACTDAVALFGDTSPDGGKEVFGKAGKPHFRPMPGDSAEFIEEALAKLRKACGEKGFTADLDESGEDMLDGDDDASPEGAFHEEE